MSFGTSYAALYDYAHELQFSREFALAFPLVLDAVIVVLAVTLLLERALGRRTMTVSSCTAWCLPGRWCDVAVLSTGEWSWPHGGDLVAATGKARAT